MKDRYIPAFITLIAGAITCIMDIINKVELLHSLKRLLVVLIIFYIIGLIARKVILKAYSLDSKKNQNEENDDEDKMTDIEKES